MSLLTLCDGTLSMPSSVRCLGAQNPRKRRRRKQLLSCLSIVETYLTVFIEDSACAKPRHMLRLAIRPMALQIIEI
jgi:hypothetical protein